MKIRAIIFDLGGTLLEYASVYQSWPELEIPGLQAAYGYLAAHGVSLPDRGNYQSGAFELLPMLWDMAVKGQRNLTVSNFLEEIIVSSGCKKPDADVLEQAARKYESAVCAGVEPLPHSLQTVRYLKEKGYRLGLVSNTMFRGVSHIADLKRFGLDSFFDSMVFSADVNKWKPSPEPFLHVLGELHTDPSHAVFIGDDPVVDVAGGHNAGLFTIHYPSSQRFPSHDGLKPDATIHNLGELPGLLDRLEQGGSLPLAGPR